jgi:hypothetical protein
MASAKWRMKEIIEIWGDIEHNIGMEGERLVIVGTRMS